MGNLATSSFNLPLSRSCLIKSGLISCTVKMSAVGVSNASTTVGSVFFFLVVLDPPFTLICSFTHSVLFLHSPSGNLHLYNYRVFTCIAVVGTAVVGALHDVVASAFGGGMLPICPADLRVKRNRRH